MEKGYEAYCLADKRFYGAPAPARREDVDFELARRPVPEGGKKHLRDDWLVYEPLGVRLAPREWKIQASATLDSAEDILRAVWDYCIPRRFSCSITARRGRSPRRSPRYSRCPRSSSPKRCG